MNYVRRVIGHGLVALGFLGHFDVVEVSASPSAMAYVAILLGVLFLEVAWLHNDMRDLQS